MNILEQTEALKDLPDQALIKEMQMPTGMAPPVFITAELKRRQRMRNEYKRREAQDMPTVAEEVVMAAGMPQGGIADAAKAMAPKSSIAQNTGMNEMMPAAPTRAPQRMAGGGIVGMRQGGKLVKVGRAKFYAFSDGEVFVENPDGSREAVTDPRVLGVVRAQANVGPERQESNTPLGSEVLQEAAPEAPTLDSTLSSDRPFSPTSMEVTDTRPAVPPSLGMGGERPTTLTDSTQTAINQQQALIDAMSPEFDTFGGDALARAEQRSNLSGPSISEVSPTVDLDLTTQPDLSEMEKARLATQFTQQQELARAIRNQQAQPQAQPYEGGEYTNADAIRNFNERTFGKPMTPADKAEERLLFNNMNIPPDSPFAEFAGVDNPETEFRGYRGGKNYRDESEDFYDDISKNLLPPQAPSEASDKPFDVMVPTIDRDSSIDKQLLSKALEAKSLPITPTEDFRREFADYGDDISPFDPSDIKAASDGPSKMEQMMQSRSVADNQGRPMGEAAAALAAMTGQASSRDPSDLSAMSIEDTITTLDPTQGYPMPQDPDEQSDIGFTEALTGSTFMDLAGSGMDVLKAGQQPNLAAAKEAYGDLQMARSIREAEEGSLGGVAPVNLTPTAFATEPEDIDSTLSQGIASIPDGFTLGTAGDTASNALSFGDVSKLVSDDAGGGDKKPTTPNTPSVTGTGSSPLKDRISRMLDEREANKESDKWMALAQTGLALMASKNPTIGGALGEAGLFGVGALQKAKSSYDKDILSLLGMQEKMRTADMNYAAKVAKANKPTTAKVGDYSTGAIRFLEAANEVRGTEKVTDETGQTSEVPKPLSKLTENERREYDKLMSDYYSFLNSIKTKLPTTVDVTT